MKLKDVIHAANLHATTAHAQAKADFADGVAPRTPGRWQATRRHPRPATAANLIQIFPESGGALGEWSSLPICDLYAAETGGIQEANARLIAAAPELLEALDTLNLVIGLTPIKGNLEALQEACDKARAAIAKAKGSL